MQITLVWCTIVTIIAFQENIVPFNYHYHVTSKQWERETKHVLLKNIYLIGHKYLDNVLYLCAFNYVVK
jgi:hypothetical protein